MQILPNELNHLHQLMNASDLRHRVLSQNLANVNTPGYQRMEVKFEEEFAKQIQRSGRQVGTVRPEVVVDSSGAIRGDGNTVDVDTEIGAMNRNAMLFQTYSQLLASQLDQMRRAIR
ncbi:flagellar basal body rod protein FlgB [Planctomicrobium sp. SH527]|uniref:flagellar basal body rod protein FlgB n=1 Tax=Planctomicrobium sp. SH527 TaxID=3448123 RepID=UPI003F5C3E06